MALLAVVGGGCGRSAPPAAEPTAYQRPFVVFTAAELRVDRLGVPVAPPVAVGSSPSPATMSSDRPEVVAIDPAGQLVAAQAGEAFVRGTAGAPLLVKVVPVFALRLEPAELELRPGEAQRLRLTAEGAATELPAASVAWATTDPAVATLKDGLVTATGRPGTARLRARYGDREAFATVTVRGAPPAFAIVPSSFRLRRGGLVRFQALAEHGGIPARWTAADPRVVAHLDGGIFEARRPGRTQVCGRVWGAERCARVEVMP